MIEEHNVYLGLGANIGDRKQAICQAIEQIEELIGTVVSQSALYETQPWGFTSPHPFINACICCRTALSPQQVLRITQGIEKKMGRTAKTHNGVYQDRLIDIDILLYDDLQLNTPTLTIPHPMMHERDFVMIPLREILETEFPTPFCSKND